MSEKSEKMKRAEQRITEELENQAGEEPGSAQEDDAKEQRALAEKEAANAQK